LRYCFLQLIILGLIFLTSCSPKDADKISQSQSQSVEGQILVWHSFEDKIKDMMQDSLNDYMQIYPNVRIVSEYIPNDQLEKQFRKQVNRGLGPDFVFTASGLIPSLIQDNLIPVIQDFDFSGYLPTAISHVRYQGKMYGIPTSVMTQTLCYNKKKVKLPPKTLTELLQQAKMGYSVGIWSNFKDNFGVALLPGEGNNPPGPFIYSRVILFNRISSPQQQQLAVKLAEFFTNPEQTRKRLSLLEGSFIPAHQNINVNSRLFPREAILVEQSKTAIAIPLDQVESARVWVKTANSLYPQVLGGSITAQDAADQITETVNQKLSQP